MWQVHRNLSYEFKDRRCNVLYLWRFTETRQTRTDTSENRIRKQRQTEKPSAQKTFVRVHKFIKVNISCMYVCRMCMTNDDGDGYRAKLVGIVWSLNILDEFIWGARWGFVRVNFFLLNSTLLWWRNFERKFMNDG